jgi:hypothetical protein
MRILSILILALGLGSTSAPRADAQAVLVELFTSQGCSSCPPADKFFGELSQRDDVVALSYHVDYWDYLGWKDTFAMPAFTERQREYAPQVDRQYIGRHMRGSFTPEMVVQGSDSLVGSDGRRVAKRISAHAAKTGQARIELSRAGNKLKIDLTPGKGGAVAARVVMARYTPITKVAIERGENAGKTLTYHNIVTDLHAVGRWDGTSATTLMADDAGGAVAVFLQRGQSGPVLAAAQLR